jgi:hypothetical protein
MIPHDAKRAQINPRKLYDWDKEEQAAWMNENLRLSANLPEKKTR